MIKKLKIVQFKKHEGNYPYGKYNNKQPHAPLLHMPDANKRHKLKRNNDPQCHRYKIAHAFNGRDEHHRKGKQGG